MKARTEVQQSRNLQLPTVPKAEGEDKCQVEIDKPAILASHTTCRRLHR